MSDRTLRAGAPVAGALGAVFLLAATLVLPLVAASAASAALDPFGAPRPANGAPVDVGMIVDGTSARTGAASLIEQGARSAVAYQDTYGAGVEGHRIDLAFCLNRGTPAGGQACAQDFVRRGVAAVIEPFSAQGQTEVPTLAQAGIPYITMTGGSLAEFTTHSSFVLEGGVPAIIGAVAQHAKQHGYKKLAIIVVDQPGVVLGVRVLGGIVFKAAGVGLEVLTAGESSNLRPLLEEAVSGGASALGVGGDVKFCSSFLHAYAGLRLHVPKYVIATCLDPRILRSRLDKVLEGSWLAGVGTPSPEDDALYAAVIDKYAPGASPSPSVSTEDFAGMLPVLSLAAIMRGSSAPVTAAGILHRMQSAQRVVLPMTGGGVAVTCNGTAISVLSSVCSSTASIGVLGRGAAVDRLESYDPTPLF